jgi:hypothetical protein
MNTNRDKLILLRHRIRTLTAAADGPKPGASALDPHLQDVESARDKRDEHQYTNARQGI